VDAKISAPAAEKFPVVPSFPMESIDFALEAVTLGDEREFSGDESSERARRGNP
jgi:hypothetical protein